jgi:hypothetical protein
MVAVSGGGLKRLEKKKRLVRKRLEKKSLLVLTLQIHLRRKLRWQYGWEDK